MARAIKSNIPLVRCAYGECFFVITAGFFLVTVPNITLKKAMYVLD
ncbi:hypothetical protein SAMN05878482_108193 [Peribacillus simplex]|uniref:Uncharacterized protein n=1 Tax=Peribacillus simplex TaxID=1478 RepID=A0A9X8RDF9_9BACI|nr:hypothetical protein SAMN05878482_108193 [Peribacillus simplex]